jgi:hypothetical protein
MLISSAILSLTLAVGVGFLLNSISRVVSWSWVARCLFWFFCCWVSVLFRGGRLDDWPLLDAEVEGDGVWLPLVRPAEDGVVAEWPLGAGVSRPAGAVPASGSVFTTDDIFLSMPLPWQTFSVDLGFRL